MVKAIWSKLIKSFYFHNSCLQRIKISLPMKPVDSSIVNTILPNHILSIQIRMITTAVPPCTPWIDTTRVVCRHTRCIFSITRSEGQTVVGRQGIPSSATIPRACKPVVVSTVTDLEFRILRISPVILKVFQIDKEFNGWIGGHPSDICQAHPVVAGEIAKAFFIIEPISNKKWNKVSIYI